MMYGSNNKFVVQAGKRDELVAILIRAAEIVGRLPGCRLYAISEDVIDETAVWVVEVWDDKEAHDASLQGEQVRSLIGQAMPLLDGPPTGIEMKVIGGHGL